MIRATLESNLNILPEFTPKRHGGKEGAGQEALLAFKSNINFTAKPAPSVRAAESFTGAGGGNICVCECSDTCYGPSAQPRLGQRAGKRRP